MLRAISTVLSAPFYLPAAVNNRMPATTHLMTIHVIHVLLVSYCHIKDNLPSTATMNKVLLTNTGMKERKKSFLSFATLMSIQTQTLMYCFVNRFNQ